MKAIYIDFECLQTKPSTPILLGVLKDVGGKPHFEQVVLDVALTSAAAASHLSVTTFQEAVETLVADAELHDCPIVGWSYFDRDLILKSNVPMGLKEIVRSRYRNALLTAKPWKSELYPPRKKAKVGKFAPKNTLDKIAALAGYPQVGTLRGGTPAKWIRDLQKALSRTPHYRRLKKTAKEKWRALLDYNEHDCRALCHIGLKTSFELEKWREYKATNYYLQPDGGKRLCFRIGSIDKKRDALLDRSGASRWAFITAWNPASRQLSAEENASRQAELAAELGKYRSLPGEGVGQDAAWLPEDSFFVLGIEATEARRIGKKFGQLAIVVGRKNFKSRLVRC